MRFVCFNSTNQEVQHGRKTNLGSSSVRALEAAWSDAEREREERERWRGGEKDGWGKDWRDRGRDKDRDERSREREALSSGDESESKFGRVQRKLESWAVLGRTKKISVDFGTLGKNLLDSQNRIGPSERSRPSSTVPSVRISGDPDEDEPLSSGQASPAYGTSPSMMLSIGSYALAELSASELSEYDRRVIEFNRKRPPKRPHLQARIVSWSDPFSAQDLDEDVETEGKLKARATLGVENEGEPEGLASDTDMEGVRRRRTTIRRLRRCHSFDATSQFKDMCVLPIERMRIDVELCGELLVMMRREQHLANIAACLAVLTARLSQTNTHLRAEHEAARPALDELRARAQVLHQVEAQRTRVDALTQETQALEYESAQFLVGDLWHMAMQPRRRVLALRERAFGTGRRHPQGVRGAHGRFDRVQWTLDGKERLVDVLGRTESEAEEEDGLPGDVAFDDSESGDEVDAVNHQTLRPTWLLRFFNYWGSRWGASKGSPKDRDSTPARESESEMEGVATTASATSLPETSAHMRSRPSIQHPNSS
ncbi:hypothetical protein WOLCODRAFT_162738 [Wolfiporia cocos MD-104 SS10]|uniref:Uncharacterized protein n=1 Tax=Wolfiporia cocos (strain MD-104) TaxID=742152 RepID=A0A2H3JGI6_WOLCO|nr:hypothetical protein WOLCODRAFT_162738 [Wolfiporia cocos MD-104 SS10]